MEENDKQFWRGVVAAALVFFAIGLFGWSILSFGASEIANNCFLAGQGYMANYLCLEVATSEEYIQSCQENLDKSLAFAEQNGCAPREVPN